MQTLVAEFVGVSKSYRIALASRGVRVRLAGDQLRRPAW